ncbi:hypothetical protein B9Z55_015134 [Caenorhabditis nigoni]|uniref:F-box domain-containing protein n=1 Tax=Caenorhabditis nigoni TaxID=1611254 RepID=A0A2G5U919_9PELO|nr:hypothetical protein B9Z55_015134 [Caenorhabditis nigoni]
MDLFDLSKLPRNLLEMALSKLSTFDLINYSNCSPKCTVDVKNFIRQRKVRFVIISEEKPEICVVHHENPHKYFQEVAMFGGRKIHAHLEEKGIRAAGKNPISGFFIFAKHLDEILNCPPIYQLEIGKQEPKESKRIIDWINQRGSSEVEHCDITSKAQMTNTDLSYVLNNVNVTTALNIQCEVQEDFHYDLPETLKHFYCDYSKWMTLDQLISPRFEFVSAYKSGFTNQDMVVYLEKVLAGDLPNLVYFQAEIEGLDINGIANGVRTVQKTDSDFRCWVEYKKYIEQNMIIIGYYDFKRDDGMIVTIGVPRIFSQSFQIFVRSEYDRWL